MTTLKQMKIKNKARGGHFFDRGNSRVLSKQGNYLVTKGLGEGYVIYKFDSSSGAINLVDNPQGAYSWQPYENKLAAIAYARKLAK